MHHLMMHRLTSPTKHTHELSFFVTGQLQIMHCCLCFFGEQQLLLLVCCCNLLPPLSVPSVDVDVKAHVSSLGIFVLPEARAE